MSLKQHLKDNDRRLRIALLSLDGVDCDTPPFKVAVNLIKRLREATAKTIEKMERADRLRERAEYSSACTDCGTEENTRILKTCEIKCIPCIEKLNLNHLIVF